MIQISSNIMNCSLIDTSVVVCCKARRSVLKGKKISIPKRITVTDHFTDLIQNGTINGDKAAILGENSSIIYSFMQLDLTANKLAKSMRSRLGYWTSNNPDGDLIIGFCLHTTESAILMILAILKLGGTYLSISTSYPEQQIVRMVGITRPLFIITESDPQIISRFDSVKHICEITTLIELVDKSESFEDDPNDPVPLESLSPPWKRPACIVLTAGTTGQPRFVRIGHSAILNRLYWQFKAVPYEEDEVACLSSLMVDCESIGEIFAPLLGGTSLYILSRHCIKKPATLMSRIQEIKISRITMTPSYLASTFNSMDEIGLDEANKLLTSLRYLIISGDTLTNQMGLNYYKYIGDSCKLIYFYGATELVSEGSFQLFEDINDFKAKLCGQQVSIGVPLCNNQIYIVDEDLSIVPEGTIGEICFSGTSLAYGYCDNQDAFDRFVQFPPSAKKSGQIKLFRTGDYGKITNSDGNSGRSLYYEGRIDMTMRIQGREIELNNIAIAVTGTHLCKDCVVLCYHRNREDQAAVAFCILNQGVEKEDLAGALKSTMKDFMIPDIYPVSELPVLPSGRLDRQKLLKLYKYRRMETTPDEWKALNLGGVAKKQAAKVLFEAISHIVGISLRFVMSNIYSTFWSIGGNSLNALIIVYMIRENGYLLSIDDFVVADSLSTVVDLMVESGKHPTTDATLLMHLCNLAEWKYSIQPLERKHKEKVVSLLSKCYSERGAMSLLAGASKITFENYLNLLWEIFIRENLSVVAVDKQTSEIVGAAMSRDINSNSRTFNSVIKYVAKPMCYWIEACLACEHIARRTTITKDRGKIVQIYMIGTDTKVESRFNITLVEFLLKGCMQKALYKGFSWTLMISASPLIRDLCGSILQYDVVSEIKLNAFVAKDKTKPFRHAGDYQTLRAYYRMFA